MNQDDTAETTGPDESHEPGQSRQVLIAKAAGLLVVFAVVGVALAIVIWLLITITVSLIGAL